MTVNIFQTITNILDADRNLIKTSTVETYVLYPDTGKALKNLVNGRIYTSSVNIGAKGHIKDYIEIDL